MSMNRTWSSVVCAAILALFAGSCPRGASPTGTPEAIPSCEPSFQQVARIEERKDRVFISGASEQAAFFAAYFQGGRIRNDGTVEMIDFNAPGVAADPAILKVSAVADDRAWFLRREVWFFDGTRAKQVPVPAGIMVDSLSVGGGRVWVSGKEGEAPAILRRENDEWRRVPFTVPRFEGLTNLTVDAGGTPYIVAQQVVPKPTPSPGEGVTDELRLRNSVWTWNGTHWNEITPKGGFFRLEADGEGVLYAIGPDIEVRRFFGGTWSPIPLTQPETEKAVPTGSDVDVAGRLWITGFTTMRSGEDLRQTSGLWLLDGESIRRVPLPSEAQSEHEVSSVSVAPDGSIWLATSTRVFRGRCA